MRTEKTMNPIKLYQKYREVASYLFFGIATTFVNWAIYAITIKIWPGALTFCNTLSWLGAVIFAYIVNKIIVFQSQKSGVWAILKEMVLFFGTRGVTGLVEIFLPVLLYRIGMDQEILGIEGFLSKVVVSVIIIVSNFFLSKFLVLKK